MTQTTTLRGPSEESAIEKLTGTGSLSPASRARYLERGRHVRIGRSRPATIERWTALIETDSLTKRHGAARGIEDVSMTIEDGTAFDFLGPNGAG